MSAPYRVNISSVLDFMKCRRRWVYKWMLNRVPRGTERPLTFGKLFHLVFESHLKDGLPMADAIGRHRQEYLDAAVALDGIEREDLLGAVEDLDGYVEPLLQWKDQYPLGPPLEVEEAFEVPHPHDPSIILRGRPDRVAPLYGRIVHVQNRTLNAGLNFGLYCELSRRSLHENIYAYALKQKYPEMSYGGTLMNLMRKLKYRGAPTKKDPGGKILHSVNELFYQGIVPITDASIEEALRCVRWWVDEMRETEENVRQGNLPAPNETIHGGPYGNSKDPFFDVLQGTVDIYDDEFFKQREDMYGAGPV